MENSFDAAPQVLLVEGDDRIQAELADALGLEGLSVTTCGSLRSAREAARAPHDLVLLDLGLPDGDGLDLCRELRTQRNELPILILTARDELEQRARGLDLGADDYVVKPFHLAELMTRVQRLLHRTAPLGEGDALRSGGVWLDPVTRRAGRDANEFELTRREFDLLAFLMERPNRPWSRDALLERVWGRDYDGGPRTVDVHVRRLRAIVELDAAVPSMIRTEYGVGYLLRTMEA